MKMQSLRRGVLAIILGVSLLGVSGCATTNTDYRGLNGGEVSYAVLGQDDYYEVVHIIGKDSDLYIKRVHTGPFSKIFDYRRLTNTPDVSETDVRLHEAGYLTYFAQEPNRGKWYMQPLGSDDSNRKEINNPDSLNPKQDHGIPSAKISTADEISKFKKLLDEGTITKEEFEQKKKQLLKM